MTLYAQIRIRFCLSCPPPTDPAFRLLPPPTPLATEGIVLVPDGTVVDVDVTPMHVKTVGVEGSHVHGRVRVL